MRWISDPSHGWLEVTFKDLAAVGGAIDDFSDYSYLHKGNCTLYLEEDCDAPKFIARHPLRNSDFFQRLPDVFIPSVEPHSNFVRRCSRLGTLRIAQQI